MAEFQSFSSKVEVVGQAILSILAGMDINQARALKILAENGIQKVEPERWYPQQSVLDSFRVVFQKIGPATVRAIGRKIPEKAQFPPVIKTLEDGLRSINMAYNMNHRGASYMGSYKYSSTGPRAGSLFCDNPYPCEMDVGLIEAIADRFRPKDVIQVRVEHAGDTCRHKGGESCTYKVTW